MDKYMIKLVFNVDNKTTKPAYMICDSNWNFNQFKELLNILHQYHCDSQHQILLCCDHFTDDFLKFSNVFQNYKKNYERFTLYFILCSSPNNVPSLLKDGVYFIQNLSHENYKWDVEHDTPLESTKLVQYKSDKYSELCKHKTSWIRQAYNYYLFYYMHSLMSSEHLLDEFRYFQMYKYLLELNDGNLSQILFNQELNQSIWANTGFTYIQENNEHTDNANSHSNNADQSNNHINNNDNNNNDQQENNLDREMMVIGNDRDWLDNFYMLSRIVILFSIVYFYSSPRRFVIVTFIGYLIYLYHNGFFRVHPVAGANNEAHIENNNQIRQDNNDPPIQQPNTININEIPQRTHTNRNDERRPNIFSFAWIFLSSFFASLVPEQPNVA